MLGDVWEQGLDLSLSIPKLLSASFNAFHALQVELGG